jgi:hypothetical protein
LIGAVLALIGIVVAYKKVSRQVAAQHTKSTLDLMGREETRIETVLPRLKEAKVLSSMILHGYERHKDEPAKLKQYIARYGFTTFAEVKSAEEVAQALPNTDAGTRQRIRARMRIVTASLEALEEAVGSRFEQYTQSLDEQMKLLSDLNERIDARIVSYERRQTKLRRAIEQYFSD